MLQDGAGPAVVFENGFTSTLDEWRTVIPEVAKFAHVFAQQKVAPPYVLVAFQRRRAGA